MPQEFDFNKIEKVTGKSIEAGPSVERKIENIIEQKIESPGEGTSNTEVAAITVTSLSSEVINKEREQLKGIENILSEGLGEAYLSMSPEKRTEFKTMGENTAKQITSLLNHVKVNAVKILKLIKKWLSFIPGINKYFLEQEVKIKTDKILKIKEL